MPTTDNAAAPSYIRAFGSSRRWVQRVFNLCDALHQAVWLGVLDADQCQALTDHHYRSTRTKATKDVNYFTDAFNLRGFFPWEQAAVSTYFDGCQSVLVGSAGGGREVLAFSHRVPRVDAFECNPDLVASCRGFLEAHGVESTVLEAKPSEVPASLGIYDGAVLGWGAYIHIPQRERRVAFLKGFRRHVKPGGPFLLSFFVNGPSAARKLRYNLASVIRKIRMAPPIERGDSLSDTFDHHFTEAEIREELSAAGFEVVFYSETRYGHAVATALPATTGN